MINDLENDWGITLLERGKAGVRLTSDGIKLRALAKNVCEEYELLLGDFLEIELWIENGRVDFGFLRLPTKSGFETVPLKKDQLLAVIPENHRLTSSDIFPITAFNGEPFIMLEKGGNYEIAKQFNEHNVKPDIRFTIWDDYAVMAMVENGLEIAILPELILKRIPYNIVTKPIDVPTYRSIGLAYRGKRTLSLAAERFVEYCKRVE